MKHIFTVRKKELIKQLQEVTDLADKPSGLQIMQALYEKNGVPFPENMTLLQAKSLLARYIKTYMLKDLDFLPTEIGQEQSNSATDN